MTALITSAWRRALCALAVTLSLSAGSAQAAVVEFTATGQLWFPSDGFAPWGIAAGERPDFRVTMRYDDTTAADPSSSVAEGIYLGAVLGAEIQFGAGAIHGLALTSSFMAIGNDYATGAEYFDYVVVNLQFLLPGTPGPSSITLEGAKRGPAPLTGPDSPLDSATLVSLSGARTGAFTEWNASTVLQRTTGGVTVGLMEAGNALAMSFASLATSSVPLPGTLPLSAGALGLALLALRRSLRA